jgi:transposase InsO family protein
VTDIATDEGWLYLAVVIDLFSRRIVGWSMKQTADRTLVIDALEMACLQRRPIAGEAIFHSDRDSQYASEGYGEVMKMYGLMASMSRKTNCWDNAVTFAQGRAVARRAVRERARSQGCGDRLDPLV